MKFFQMKTVVTALCVGATCSSVPAAELRAEIDSHEEAFHHALHKAPEMYLVCYHQVEKKPLGKGFKAHLEIKAVVVDVFRGGRKIGDRIEFQRVVEGEYGDISKLPGTLSYVQYYKDDDERSPEFGKLRIDPQDPQAVFRYDPKLSAMAAEHKAKAGEGGAAKRAEPER